MIIGIWFIFNGIWNSSTDYYSILKNNKFQKNKRLPKLEWLLLVILDTGCLITSFMRYGFNNVHKPM